MVAMETVTMVSVAEATKELKCDIVYGSFAAFARMAMKAFCLIWATRMQLES